MAKAVNTTRKLRTGGKAINRLVYAERALRLLREGASYEEIVQQIGQPRWENGSKMGAGELREWVISVFTSDASRSEMVVCLQAKWARESTFDVTDVFTMRKGKVYLRNLASIPPEARQMIASLKQTGHGVEVKFRDIQRSEDMLARSLGAFKDKLEHSGDASFAALVAASFGQKAPDAKEPSDGE